MLPFEDRYTRQRQVREVGLKGQAQIAALTSRLPASAAGFVALNYLERAGATQVTTAETVTVPAFPYLAHFTPTDLAPGSLDTTPLAVAQGCYLALQEIRQALGLVPKR